MGRLQHKSIQMNWNLSSDLNDVFNIILFSLTVCVLCNQLSKILIRMDISKSFYSQHLKALIAKIYSLNQKKIQFWFSVKKIMIYIIFLLFYLSFVSFPM